MEIELKYIINYLSWPFQQRSSFTEIDWWTKFFWDFIALTFPFIAYPNVDWNVYNACHSPQDQVRILPLERQQNKNSRQCWLKGTRCEWMDSWMNGWMDPHHYDERCTCLVVVLAVVFLGHFPQQTVTLRPNVTKSSQLTGK